MTDTNPPAAARMLALVLLATPLAALGAPTAEAATTRVLVIDDALAQPQVPFKDFDGNPPKVFDIDGDGRLEIIAQNDNQWVYVFDSGTGAILAQVKTNLPPGWTARSFNGPEVSVLSVNGTVRMVLANSAAVVTSYKFNISDSTGTRFKFDREWERRLGDCYDNPGMDAKPVLADLDRDGTLDIVAATEESGIYALRSDGRLLWKACIGGGNAEPAVADLDLDGWPEVVFASDAGVVTALHGRWGGTVWSYNARTAFNLHSGSMPVGPGIGQLDGVGGPDIVVGARDSHDSTDWNNSHALLLALDSNGRLLWGKQHPQGNPLTYTHAIVADADDDGANEVYWGDWNTIGHKPPANESDAWKRTGPANFFRYAADGTLVWRQSLDTFWSNKDIALADADGDGVQEVLANGPDQNGHDGIWYLDARTGVNETFVDLYPYQAQRGPIVADLGGDGGMDFVVPVSSYGGQGSDAILVYDTGAPYNAKWPHLPYPVAAPGLPPPSGEQFSSTFTIKSPNQWWQEVHVQPATARTIANVELRLDGGAWRPMELRSWGAWTSSYHAPAGTVVEFLATDAGRAQSQSEPFRWLDGTLSRNSTTVGDPPPAFNATFEPADGINEWWVDVKVRATDPLAGVDARIDGGAWVALSATSWGTWAKSFHVPQGSRVEFRATSTTGLQALSETFIWLGEPEPQPFSVTFEPRQVGNDWWIEVKVSSTRPLTVVETSLNGGEWKPLEKTSWGTWAKSYHAPNGTTVTFRATSEADGSIESGTTVWT